MRRWKNAVAVATTLGLLALSVYPFVKCQSLQQPPAETENRIPLLRRLVDEHEQESARAAANYHPKTRARIDDVTITVADLLRQLPGVVQVQVAVPAGDGFGCQGIDSFMGKGLANGFVRYSQLLPDLPIALPILPELLGQLPSPHLPPLPRMLGLTGRPTA